ncbi:MAG: VanZ family protein [Bacteroidales bacterium]|nr:VanZ family protein [Bacteroidales bacterium]
MKNKVIISRILFAIYIVAVIWLCVHSFKNLDNVRQYIFGIMTDKVVHFLMFFPFPFLLYISYNKTRYNALQSVIFFITAMCCGFVMATATEYAQSFIPYRTPDRMDLVADVAGLLSCALPILVYDIIDNTKHNKRKKK